MKSAENGSILRNIAFGAQPRSLQRARTPLQLAASTAEDRVALPQDSAAAVALKAAVDAGHAEGLARGREEGFRAGYSEGATAAQQRIDEAVSAARALVESEAAQGAEAASVAQAAIADSLRSTCASFEQAAADRLAALEGDAVELAFAAVCKIVADDGRSHDQVARVVKAALQSLRGAKLLRVRVNAEDLDRLDANGRVNATAAAPGPVEWVADPSVAPGGCILDSERGSVDARLQVQLERLRRQWAQVEQAAAVDAGASSL